MGKLNGKLKSKVASSLVFPGTSSFSRLGFDDRGCALEKYETFMTNPLLCCSFVVRSIFKKEKKRK